MSRAVVIGAGVGGLAVAARLAAAGHEVEIFEAAPVVGGKLGHYVHAGFDFDTGPSILTMPYVLEDLFRETGEPLGQSLELQRLDPITRYCFPDGTTLDMPANPDDLRDRLVALGGERAATDWIRFWSRAEQIWTASRPVFLESPIGGVGTLLRQLRMRDLRTVAPWSTLHGLAQRYLSDPRLVQLVDRYATYTGSDPRRAPAALAAVPYAELSLGGWYVRGGLYRITEALLARCVRLGVRVHTAAPVARLDVPGGRIAGVIAASGERVPADVVVSDADATHLYEDLLPREVTTAPRRNLAKASPSLSGFVLLLGVRGRTSGLAHHTVLFPACYEAEFDAVFGSPAHPPDDPTLYVSVPDDPVIRPGGSESWFVLVNAPRHGTGPGAIDWTAPGLAERYADHVLAVLARRGLDVRDRIVFRHVRTPYDLERETGAVGGAIYGSSSNGVRAAFLRPANRSPIPGLFLVGGSAHPGGGLPLAMLSAQITAGLIGPA